MLSGPGLSKGSFARGKDRAVGGGWGLAGEVSGHVFGGGVCIGAQVGRGCGCSRARTVLEEVGLGAGKRGANPRRA